MTPDSKVYVAGHRGLVGSALLRRLAAGGFYGGWITYRVVGPFKGGTDSSRW